MEAKKLRRVTFYSRHSSLSVATSRGCNQKKSTMRIFAEKLLKIR
jgi:hypothetical protein